DQPLELERTKSLHYSAFNVEALSRVAEIGRLIGIDLWSYESPERGSLKKALDHLAKYAADPQAWPGQEISTVGLDEMVIHLRRGDAAYGDKRYQAALSSLPATVVRADRSALLYP